MMMPPMTPGASPSFSWCTYCVTTGTADLVVLVVVMIIGGGAEVVHAQGLLVIVSKVVLAVDQMVAVSVAVTGALAPR